MRWRPPPYRYLAEVVGRQAEVWREGEGWAAHVQGRSGEPIQHSSEVWESRNEAMRWTLDRLAGLALEFDELPGWLQRKD